MKKIMHILFLSCLKASEFIEKKLHFKLSFTEKVQLELHKIMCSACSRYEKQSILIEKSIELQNKEILKIANIEDLKKTITEKLDTPDK